MCFWFTHFYVHLCVSQTGVVSSIVGGFKCPYAYRRINVCAFIFEI